MENIQITSFDEAVKHLTPVVNRISRSHKPQDQDDVSQACWLEIFNLIKARGAVDSALLVMCAARAARKESKANNNHGLTPRSSKFKRPRRIGFIPDTPMEDADENFIRDLVLDSDPLRTRIVEATQQLISVGKAPTQNAIAELLGITRKTVRQQLYMFRKKYNDDDQD